MIRLPGCLFLLGMSLHAVAQTDSLTISDTIGLSRQRVFLQTVTGYSYYGASRLVGSQLNPILKRSPDPVARTLFGQSRRLSGLATGLLIGGLGLIVESSLTAGRRYGSNSTLLLSGDLLFLGSLVPQSISSRRLTQAVAAHNKFLLNRPTDYVPPVVYATMPQWPLSLADTIARHRAGLTWHYSYRGIRVYPYGQLGRLTAGMNDREVNEGVRYVRTINGIGALVGSVGRVLLTSYLTTLLLNRNRRYGRSGSSLSDEFLTTGLICIGANFVLSRHANQVQRRWVSRYNEVLKQRYQAP